MGLKLNLGSAHHKLEGFINLDEEWLAQTGLDYKDKSIEAITISHLIFLLTEIEIGQLMEECYRVLVKGGVLRITEDFSVCEPSSVFGGYRGTKTLLGPDLFKKILGDLGFKVYFDNYYESKTQFKDKSLIQVRHGYWPHAFHIEGVKREN